MSHQDFLLSRGYSVNVHEEAFVKWASGWQRVSIPFSDLAGHTEESFRKLVEKREEKETDFFHEPESQPLEMQFPLLAKFTKWIDSHARCSVCLKQGDACD